MIFNKNGFNIFYMSLHNKLGILIFYHIYKLLFFFVVKSSLLIKNKQLCFQFNF